MGLKPQMKYEVFCIVEAIIATEHWPLIQRDVLWNLLLICGKKCASD